MTVENNDIPFYSSDIYIPSALSEIEETLTDFIGEAPTFIDDEGYFPQQNIDSRFLQLTKGFSVVREKLGEQNYAALIDRAARAKTLFTDDPGETNGKTMLGIELIHEMLEIIDSIRERRVKTGQLDDDGEVTGD